MTRSVAESREANYPYTDGWADLFSALHTLAFSGYFCMQASGERIIMAVRAVRRV